MGVQKKVPYPCSKYTSIWSKPKHISLLYKKQKLHVSLNKKWVLKEGLDSLMESLQKISMMNNYNFKDVQIVTVNNPQFKEKRYQAMTQVI